MFWLHHVDTIFGQHVWVFCFGLEYVVWNVTLSTMPAANHTPVDQWTQSQPKPTYCNAV